MCPMSRVPFRGEIFYVSNIRRKRLFCTWDIGTNHSSLGAASIDVVVDACEEDTFLLLLTVGKD